MSLRILISRKPQRTIALVSKERALLFRKGPQQGESPDTSSASLSASQEAFKRCAIQFVNIQDVDPHEYEPLTSQPLFGALGLIAVGSSVFLSVVTAATQVANLRPGETVQQILNVEFYCITSNDYDNILHDDYNVYPPENSSLEGLEEGPYQNRNSQFIEHPCASIKKLLSGGSFYFTTNFDLTNRLQDRAPESFAIDINDLDDGFLWNNFMINPLLKFRSHLAKSERKAFDNAQFITTAIRGFVESITIPVSASPARLNQSGHPSVLTLISRLSCRRAGTRFNSRGMDDDGNVANFVETETIFWIPPDICYSYVQVRGSVPVFWEQSAGILPNQQKITITRSKEATQPTFDKHFERMGMEYGVVHIVNLLSDSKPGEVELTNRYRYHVRQCSLNAGARESGPSKQLLRETAWDFHHFTKGPSGYDAAKQILELIGHSVDSFSYYLSQGDGGRPDSGPSNNVILQQEGVFRTNCLDCLDRTNLIQTIISQAALESFLRQQNSYGNADFWMRHSTLWADNGDNLSKTYAGTGALKSSFTRLGKMSLAGALADARKSATRMYINNFTDKSRQHTIDMLLSTVELYDPINDFVNNELSKRAAEFSSNEIINIYTGTFNLNGQAHGIKEDLTSWICPWKRSQPAPEIAVVAFQEMVELSPQQIMSTDPARRQKWEKALLSCLNSEGSERYVMLRSGQLVGAALCVFVKSSILEHIKNVEGSLIKTGLSGMAGNKGAVAIRLDYENTKICFVTAHLAAGFANYEERNRDYETINTGLRFQRNRAIADHDTIIWLGDFNYRIGLSDEKVRNLIRAEDYETLYSNDQLNLQMVAGLAFRYYSEARITFPPTYKYDNGSDTYDTSEKARIPAWTDRILRRGANIKQTSYGTAPLRFSDHRPVYATFQCQVTVINEALRDELSQQLYKSRRKAPLFAKLIPDDTGGGNSEQRRALPPASTDKSKWWLENGQPAKSAIKPPDGQIPNPQRTPNPFHLSEQPAWASPGDNNRSSQQEDLLGAPPPVPPPRRKQVASPQTSTSSALPSAGQGPPPFKKTSSSESSLVALRPSAGIGPPPGKPSPNKGENPPAVPPPRRAATTSLLDDDDMNVNFEPALQARRTSNGPPPVPKKPQNLASFSGASQSPTSPKRSSTGKGFVPYSDTPRPQRTPIGSSPADSGGSGMQKITTKSDSSSPFGAPQRTGTPSSGLMDSLDEGHDGLNSWKPLAPQK